MATNGERSRVKPLSKRIRNIYDKLPKMGQGERHLAAWLYRKNEDVLSKVKAGTEADEALRSKGFRFARSAFLEPGYTQQQSNDVSRRLKKFVRYGLVVTFSDKGKGKHITHIRLTELGKAAGAFYFHFGLRSPKELDEAVKFSAYRQRKKLQRVKQHILFPHADGLSYGVDTLSLITKLEDDIRARELAFIDYLIRPQSPERRARTIDLARALRDVEKQHEFIDGPTPLEFCDPRTVDFEDAPERDHLSTN